MTDAVRLMTGDLALLDAVVARELLASKELARLAYVGADGTPRVLPMLFHWTGTHIVVATFGGGKVSAIRRRPDVALTIDRASQPPQALFIRGRAEIRTVHGVVAEYRQAQVRYGGQEQAARALAAIDQPGLRMHRIAITPTWVELIDFVDRFPGGNDASSFARRGR